MSLYVHRNETIRRRQFVTIVMMLCIWHSGSSAQTMNKDAPHQKSLEALRLTIDKGRSLIKEPPESAFVDVEFEDLPEEIKGSISNMFAFFMNRSAMPVWYKIVEGTPRRSKVGTITSREVKTNQELAIRVYAAFGPGETDLVEYWWPVAGQSVRALIRLEVVRLDFNLDEVQRNPALDDHGAALQARVQGLLARLIKTTGHATLDRAPYELHVPWPASFDEGTKFSTNPDALTPSVNAYKWFDRVDGYVAGGVLSMMFYLKSSQSPIFHDGSKWFPDDFRAWVHEQAAAQGRLPDHVED